MIIIDYVEKSADNLIMDKRIFKFFAGVLCSLIFAGLFTGCGQKKVKVGFCNLPEKVQSAISDELVLQKGDIFVFDSIICGTEKDAKKLAKKYDLIFGWNGDSISKLKDYGKDLPVEFATMVPDSIFGSSTKTLPLLMDHYGLCYNVSVKSKAKTRYPGSFADLEKYLKKISGKVVYPLMLSCDTNEKLLAFIGVLCESAGGISGYEAYLEALKNYTSPETLLATKISSEDTIGSLIGTVKNWQKKGYMHEGWYKTTYHDLANFAMDGMVGVMFMSLSEYHGLKYEISRDFVCDRMVVKNSVIPHGVVAPYIVGLSVSDNPVNFEILENLIADSGQKNLSKKSALAPAGIRGMAFDQQADDVRYLAASCEGGPFMDPGLALFENNQDELSKICDALRLFFKN